MRYFIREKPIPGCIILLLTILWGFSVRGQPNPPAFINGDVQVISSHILEQDQTIYVYLPEGYAQSDQAYPVHYVTNAPHLSTLFSAILEHHAAGQAMPQSIIVGLSGKQRESHLHVEQGASNYLKYVTDEVIPFIEQHYRTHPFRSIVGHSLGGGFALYAFCSRPEMFNTCIAGSPYPIAAVSARLPGKDHFGKITQHRLLYASIGTIEEVSQPHFLDFKTQFLTAVPPNFAPHFRVNIGEDHLSNTAVNFQDGLEALYADWQFVLPDTLETSADQLLMTHYRHLSQQMGYPVEVSEGGVIFPVMDQLAQRGDFTNAIRVLKYDLTVHPQSDQAYAFLARAYMSVGKPDSARIHVQKALEINPQNPHARQLQTMLND